MKTCSQLRRGFTLVELLVVMGLIAILATLAIAFFPNAASSQMEARAATGLQSWLTVAKQRAMRDQAPRGVRLWVTTAPAGAATLANVVTDCQYIEQPPDFPGNADVSMMGGLAPNGSANLSCVMFMPAGSGIITNGATTVTLPNVAAQAEFWPVQPGDSLEILGTGLMHQIVQIGVVANAATPTVGNADYVLVSPPLTYPVNPTTSFRVVRAPRVTGDETLKMPDSTLIDLGTNNTYGNALPVSNAMDNGTGSTGFIDILFAPSGEVISPGVANANINLWVRSPNVDHPTDVFRGAPTIISVFTKTGFVGAYPPDPTGTNPYLLVK